MQDYRQLHVWQKAHQLAVDTYDLPRFFGSLRRGRCAIKY